jgi:hypothetical protein
VFEEFDGTGPVIFTKDNADVRANSFPPGPYSFLPLAKDFERSEDGGGGEYLKGIIMVLSPANPGIYERVGACTVYLDVRFSLTDLAEDYKRRSRVLLLC